ncbi:MAG TPA: hypothetical protein EYP71_06210 [Dehalococcoidia bacterium]|nr:hypothetical protein [Dehalococcoidia bacterium]
MANYPYAGGLVKSQPRGALKLILGANLYDTIIVGAGVVGSYLAWRLSWLGYQVLVLERKATVGQNVCCTGIVSRQCLDLLASEDSLILREASSAEFLAPSGKRLQLSRNDEVAYIIDRPALDMMLARRAQSSGTCYLFRTLVTDIQVATDGVSVIADYEGEQRLFEAETAVIATGFGSALPDKLKLGKISDFVFGAQAEVDVGDLKVVRIYLDHNLAPGGFAWLVPTVGGKGLAGLVTRRQPEQHLSKLLSTLKAEGVLTSTRAVSCYAPIPLRPLPSSYTDRVLVVGEAAG